MTPGPWPAGTPLLVIYAPDHSGWPVPAGYHYPVLGERVIAGDSVLSPAEIAGGAAAPGVPWQHIRGAGLHSEQHWPVSWMISLPPAEDLDAQRTTKEKPAEVE